jgi:ferritin-like metal-binding protein YciE
MKFESLHDLFVGQIRDLYDAENQIVKALPKLTKEASSPQVKQALEKHLQQTKSQVTRLEEIFDELGMSPSGMKCAGIRGIIDEGEEVLGRIDDPSVKDVAMICAAQKVEHYEMAAYGCACAFAEQIGEDRVRDLLARTLEEEKQTDRELTQIAESGINASASIAKTKS